MKTPLPFIEICSILALRMRIKMRKLIPISIILLVIVCNSKSYGQCLANFIFDDSSLVVPFENTSQNVAGDPIITFDWDFGDGINSDNESPQHIYANAGAYLASLAIQTESGCRDTISKSIYICNFNLDYDLQVGCDEDNRVTLDLVVEDIYENAGPFNISLDGENLNETPIILTNNTISLSTDLLADGLEHIISIAALDFPNCSISEIITVSACVPPCNLSNINVEITNTDTIVAEVTESGYNPDALNISTGSNVLFKWVTDNRSVTSGANTNGQNWDSGILNNGDEFLLYSFAPGIFNYSSSNTPPGFNAGSLVSTCPDTTNYNLQLTFENGGQVGMYELWIDGVPTEISHLPYRSIGLDTLHLIMPGDGVLHEYSIVDMASSSCFLKTEIQAPLCAAESECNVYLEAAQSSTCDQDSLVEVTFTVLAAGGSGNGFDLYIDDEIFEMGIPYNGTETTITKLLFGDGEEHTIAIQDLSSDSCSASTTILLEDCAQPCLIINPFAGVGSNNNIVVNVLNDSFTPSDITISAGDKIIWQFQTDTLRSVTAFDFLFDSGVQGFGASFTSPVLPVGVHRYFSEFNNMEGSITVEPNCNNSLIPIVYSFNKFGGANTGYDVFVDDIKINGSPINYQANGNNFGNSFVVGDGNFHTVEIVDAVDSTCATLQTFEVPFCDESTCALFLENLTIDDCQENNTVVIHANLLSFNTTDTLLIVSLDGIEVDSVTIDTSGITPLEINVPGDGLTHTLIIRDVFQSLCADTLSFDAPVCNASCAFSPIQIEYIEESIMDTCFDGNTQIVINSQGVQDFNSDYIVSITSSSNISELDTFNYPLDGNIFQSYILPADGSLVQVGIVNSTNLLCNIDTTFTLFECEPDPCNLSLIDLEYGSCMNDGVMDITVTIDTFRISDSLSIELDNDEVFRGTYDEYFTEPTFQITYTGEERTIRAFDINNSSCRLSETFFTPVCPINCMITASYMLVDSCILAQDSSYTILLTADVLNMVSDSVEIQIVSTNATEIFTYSDLVSGIPLEISVADDNPTIGIFDLEDNICRDFISIIPPDCILDCSISILSVSLVDSICINGEQNIDIKIDYDLPTSDSLQLHIDNLSTIEIPYPLDSIITTTIIGDGLIHNFIINDLENDQCTDTLATIIEACEFSCQDFFADFSFTIDTLTQTINFVDQTTGGSDTWNWDLGDGTVSSDANPFHTYSSIGTYTICLSVENSEANCNQVLCKEIELVDINCNASFNLQTDGLMVSFSNTSTAISTITNTTWTINNETELIDIESGSFTAENTSTFEICLSIETESGCMDTNCETIDLIKPCNLEASFEFEIVLDTIVLNNTSTGDYTNLSWTLGDGSILTEENIEHVYSEEGDYTICMTIEDTESENCDFTICEDISIVTCNLNSVFLVNINQDTLNVELVNSLEDNEILWDFGNGFSASINPVQFVYQEEGDYTVCATVTDTSQENCIEIHCEEISIILSDLDHTKLNSISVYPNPIKGGDLITVENPEGFELDISIYTTTGKLLNNSIVKENHSYKIDTIDLKAGRYLVKINTTEGTITKAIIIID